MLYILPQEPDSIQLANLQWHAGPVQAGNLFEHWSKMTESLPLFNVVTSIDNSTKHLYRPKMVIKFFSCLLCFNYIYNDNIINSTITSNVSCMLMTSVHASFSALISENHWFIFCFLLGSLLPPCSGHFYHVPSSYITLDCSI